MANKQKQTGHWIRQSLTLKGDYFFSGSLLTTIRVQENLMEVEVFSIYLEIQSLVTDYGGQDYLQVFQNSESGQQVFLIDNLTKPQIKSGNYKPEENYCTLMLAEEY